MILSFVNRKNCRTVLKKKLTLNRKYDNGKLGFQPDVRIFVSEYLSPYKQHLAWKCRELERAGKIQNCWSAKDVVKIRKTINNRPIAITHHTDIASLYSNFVFKEKTRSGRVAFQKENKIRVS